MNAARRKQPTRKLMASAEAEEISSKRQWGTVVPGFTLIELLTVIAVVAILAAMLLPALTRSKDKARTVNCLSNLKQLATCFHLYVTDNSDALPLNNYVETFVSTNSPNPYSTSESWCPDDPRHDATPTRLQQGVLWPYNSSVGIYHCPADKSTLDGSSQLRWRSYNMSQSINGAPTDQILQMGIQNYSRYTEVKRPSSIMVFVDENQDTEYDAQFGFNPSYAQWFDMPADRHAQGAGLSFVDGHVERWRWAAPKVFLFFGQSVAGNEMGDWERLRDAIVVE